MEQILMVYFVPTNTYLHSLFTTSFFLKQNWISITEDHRITILSMEPRTKVKNARKVAKFPYMSTKE